MHRRNFLTKVVAVGLVAALSRGIKGLAAATDAQPAETSKLVKNKLAAPASGRIPVAVLISEGVTVIDFAGPWEVFQDVMIAGRGEGMEQMPFELFTVSEKRDPVTGSGGLKLVPDHTFETAPVPRVVVVPAQQGSKRMSEWLSQVVQKADVTMSVCTGAFALARAGLLDGKPATTHHLFVDKLAKEFPKIDIKRDVRFVENDKISTAAGLTSGIDLALRVVERYFGREVAQTTADYMEHHSKDWMT